MYKIKDVINLVKNGEAIVLMNDVRSVERIEKAIDKKRDMKFAQYIYAENGEIKWGKEVRDFEADFIDESEIDYS